MKKILKFGIVGILFLFTVFYIILKNVSGTTKVVALKNDINKRQNNYRARCGNKRDI